jgi:hypothetical protein
VVGAFLLYIRASLLASGYIIKKTNCRQAVRILLNGTPRPDQRS